MLGTAKSETNHTQESYFKKIQCLELSHLHIEGDCKKRARLHEINFLSTPISGSDAGFAGVFITTAGFHYGKDTFLEDLSFPNENVCSKQMVKLGLWSSSRLLNAKPGCKLNSHTSDCWESTKHYNLPSKSKIIGLAGSPQGSLAPGPTHESIVTELVDDWPFERGARAIRGWSKGNGCLQDLNGFAIVMHLFCLPPPRLPPYVNSASSPTKQQLRIL